jgi:hypothetical protein
MDLYLISIGAYQPNKGIDCVLLVEEFQKPAAQQALAADSIDRLVSSNLHSGMSGIARR